MKEPLRALMEKIDTERARAHALGNHDYESGLVFAWNDLVTLHAARQSAPALVTARDAHFFEAGVAEGKRLAAEELDVERLRAAIYAVSVRHDWANTTDTEDRTEEIAREYAARVVEPR